MVPRSDREITVLGCVDLDERFKMMQCDDPMASYVFYKRQEGDPPVVCIPKQLDPDRLDYNIMPPPEFEDVYKGTDFDKEGLPLSFLQVDTVEQGEQCALLAVERFRGGPAKRGARRQPTRARVHAAARASTPQRARAG